MTHKPPAWLRITWYYDTPDEHPEEYEPVDYDTTEYFAQMRLGMIRRNVDAIPDRWIYHLFRAHLTNAEIAKRCGLVDAIHVCGRIKELVDRGVITEQQRRERRAAIAARRGRSRDVLKRGPSRTDLYLRTVHHYEQTANTRKTAKAMGVSPATVSRYVRHFQAQGAA